MASQPRDRLVPRRRRCRLPYVTAKMWDRSIIAVCCCLSCSPYRQTCRAYPNGGWRLHRPVQPTRPEPPGPAARACFRLKPCGMTVASRRQRVVRLDLGRTTAVPSGRTAVGRATVVLMILNRRGVRDSGRSFAIPTVLLRGGGRASLPVLDAQYLFGNGVPMHQPHIRSGRAPRTRRGPSPAAGRPSVRSGCTR